MSEFRGVVVLVTGGTGLVGKAIETVVNEDKIKNPSLAG